MLPAYSTSFGAVCHLVATVTPRLWRSRANRTRAVRKTGPCDNVAGRRKAFAIELRVVAVQWGQTGIRD